MTLTQDQLRMTKTIFEMFGLEALYNKLNKLTTVNYIFAQMRMEHLKN